MVQTSRCLLDGDPYKPPFGDCAIFSQSAAIELHMQHQTVTIPKHPHYWIGGFLGTAPPALDAQQTLGLGVGSPTLRPTCSGFKGSIHTHTPRCLVNRDSFVNHVNPPNLLGIAPSHMGRGVPPFHDVFGS